jgi:hypothetical protein
MRTSESLVHLAPALAQVHAQLRAIGKDSVNPHFHSTFASLEAIMSAVRPVLAAHGLSVLQGAHSPHTDEAGRLVAFNVETTLLHASGEWATNVVVMPVAKCDPQGAGAALSYGRRYGVSALLALVTDEDLDGNDAMPVRAGARPVPGPNPAPPPAAARSATSAPAPASAPSRPKAPAGMATAGDLIDETLARVNATGTASSEPECPKCGGRMWDNRVGKKNPKAPDYKCRDKACEGLFWPGQWPPLGEGRPGRTDDDEGPDAFEDGEIPF